MPDQVFSGVGWSAALRSLPGFLLRDARSRGLRLRRFWIRRVLRIVPPFAAAALGIAIAAASGVMVWHWPSFIGAVTLTKNTSLLAGDWFFGHIWSLSLEEQFYLLWPLVFALAIGTRRKMAVLLDRKSTRL